MHLIACESCDRQYDVTHLVPGGRVHCLCDEILTVSLPKVLAVETLKCTTCGGAVGAADPECPYCHAKLSLLDRRASTLCPKCMVRIPDDAKHCSGCGVAIQPQALTPIPEGKKCLRCEGALMNRALGSADVVECEDCEGIWVRSEVFDAVCNRACDEAVFSMSRKKGAEPQMDAPDQVKYIPCLACGELMFRKQFQAGPRWSGVIIDYCKDHGVWLDRRELEKIVQFLRDNPGAFHQPMPRISKPMFPVAGIETGHRSTMLEDWGVGSAIGIVARLVRSLF